MSYRLQKKTDLAGEVRRIAREQIDTALEHLQNPGDDRDEAIHEARKCFKKVRAVLRLVRDDLGSDAYKRENVCYRDAGRQLAPLRDSVVMIRTLTELQDKHELALPDEAVAQAHARLKEQHQVLLSTTFAGPDAPATQVIATVEAARARVAEWPLSVDSFADIAPSVRRVYRRGFKRRREALAEPAPARFHEWRKRVKYLWYHVRILRPVWPAIMRPLADEIHDLSDYLGDDHDLAVLADWLVDKEDLFPPDVPQRLSDLVTSERRLLEAQAEPLGQRLYAEKPDGFMPRLEAYWQAWRA